MAVFSKTLQIPTQGNCDTKDITDLVSSAVTQSKIVSGIVTVFAPGATAGITTIEYEPGLLKDFKAMCERTISPNEEYEHNAAWQDGNGHSHLRASLVGPSLTVPMVDGRMTLGTWQQIVLIDFDVRTREREILVQIVGE